MMIHLSVFYYADPESFSNYLSDFKKNIDTVEFNPQKE